MSPGGALSAGTADTLADAGAVVAGSEDEEVLIVGPPLDAGAGAGAVPHPARSETTKAAARVDSTTRRVVRDSDNELMCSRLVDQR